MSKDVFQNRYNRPCRVVHVVWDASISGFGAVAAQLIPRDTWFEYEGIWFAQTDNPPSKSLDYCISVDDVYAVDAHPSLDSDEGHFFSAFLNEPTHSLDELNCAFLIATRDSVQGSAPFPDNGSIAYQTFMTDMNNMGIVSGEQAQQQCKWRPWVVTKRDIQKGEWLKICYGPAYERSYTHLKECHSLAERVSPKSPTRATVAQESATASSSSS